MTKDGCGLLAKISEISDYSALVKLAGALWQQDDAYHGAAIMVGAGFSRSAAQTGDVSRSLPLWFDFSKKIAEELDPKNKNLPFSDPLRLAEEYHAHFGRQSLNDLIKRTINDSSWTPGDLHKSLLSLPWSEVLTTNWDTLLERASQEIHDPIYNVVSKQADLSYVRSPRITKLHGTINSTEELIFTQEDYRKYPVTHAAFVNFARQVFIENELCLLGFSGDDPNFLQWAGWVRDHLATHARRIYLIGALNLTAAKRKYLESINVAPIDLSELVKELDDQNAAHFRASELFIEALNHLRPKSPSEWKPEKINIESPLGEIIPLLEIDRKSYPGWLICPHDLRWEIQNQINFRHLNKEGFNSLSQVNKEKLLYEVAWRYSITFEMVPDWVCDELLNVCDPSNKNALSNRQQLEIALLLLKNSRWLNAGDGLDSLVSTTTKILEDNTRNWPDLAAELAYHEAIIAREDFDFYKLEKLLDRIVGKDPIWKMRKASLLAELGQFDEGESLLIEAFQELLTQFRNDQKSIYIFSRLSWVDLLLKAVRSWGGSRSSEALPSIEKKWKCDPWDQIEHIKYRVEKEFDAQNDQIGIQPLFGPGLYKDNSKSIRFSNELHLLLLVNGVTQVTGLPLRWESSNFLGSQIEKMVLLNEVDGSKKFCFSIRIANSDSSRIINSTFSRVNLACASQDEIDKAKAYCERAIDFWRNKLSGGAPGQKIYYIDRLRVFIEVFARLMVRTSPDMAVKAFKLAADIAHEKFSSHMWLHQPISSLLKYSLDSIPRARHDELIFDALNFPLPTVGSATSWPNPIIRFPGIRKENLRQDHRVLEIIRAISTGFKTQVPVIKNPVAGMPVEMVDELNKSVIRPSLNTVFLQRIIPLVTSGFTTEIENSALVDSVYGSDYDFVELPKTGFFPHVFMLLPSSKPEKIRALVVDGLFKDEAIMDLYHLQAMIEASKFEGDDVVLLPAVHQAIRYFDQMTAWRGRSTDYHPLDFRGHENNKLGGLISEALSRVVIPTLSPAELTKERFSQLQIFWREVDSPALILAFSYFAAVCEVIAVEVERIIRRCLQDRDPSKVAYAAFSILKWRELSNSLLPKNLTSRVIYIIESGRTIGLVSLLWTIHEMYKKDWLDADEVELLADVVPKVFDESDYARVAHSNHDAANASMVRVECVKIACNLVLSHTTNYSELMHMLERARNDMLPEVRFSVNEHAE